MCLKLENGINTGIIKYEVNNTIIYRNLLAANFILFIFLQNWENKH